MAFSAERLVSKSIAYSRCSNCFYFSQARFNLASDCSVILYYYKVYSCQVSTIL